MMAGDEETAALRYLGAVVTALPWMPPPVMSAFGMAFVIVGLLAGIGSVAALFALLLHSSGRASLVASAVIGFVSMIVLLFVGNTLWQAAKVARSRGGGKQRG